MQLHKWASHPGAAIAIALCAALLLLPPPNMPSAGLDPSWVLALENASRGGLLFGRDFIFSFGPFGFLASRLYDPQTYGLAILSDLLLTAIFLIPLLWSRRPLVLVLYGLAILAATLAPLALDARVVAAFLVVSFLGMRDRGWAAVFLAVLLSPLLLSKFSYALAGLPLLALADLYRLAAFRRLPALVPVSVGAMVLGMLATGHPLAMLPMLAGNIWELIAGYGGAMNLDKGGILPLLAAFAAMAALAAGSAWVAIRRQVPIAGEWKWLRPAIAVLAIVWALFIALKMGHTRQSPLHLFLTWHAFVLIIPVVFAFFDSMLPLKRAEAWVFGGLMAGCLAPIPALDLAVFIYFTDPSPIAYAGQRARDLAWRPIDTLAWLTPQRWQGMSDRRREVESEIARELPAGITGTMDVIPFNLAPLIVSGAQYRPRPVPQSYSSYTPRLQNLEAAHFENPATAPDTLFLSIGDIDYRLPTFATGPSLPILARWYDAVGANRLGMILRRRAAPRASRVTTYPGGGFALGQWVAVPHVGDRLLVARIDVGTSLAGKLIGFIARDPILQITLRYDDGREQSFRFVPGMARAGFVLSPMALGREPANMRGAAAIIERRYAPEAARPVVAFRIAGGGMANRAFAGGRASYQAIELAPGFTQALPAMAAPRPAVVHSRPVR